MGMTRTSAGPQAGTARRGSSRSVVATTVPALLLLLAACGQAGSAAGSPPTTGPATTQPTAAPTAAGPGGDDATSLPPDPVGADLVLVVGAPGAQQPPVTLVCDWAGGTSGGTHPNAGPACADLLTAIAAGDPFAPVPPDVMCTQQYGGDAVVEVTGAVRGGDGTGVDVSATFTLTDGCQIDRFGAVGAVLAPYRGAV